MSVYKPTGTPLGYPLQQRVSLNYSELLVLQSSNLVPESRLFRLNSLYDPNFSGVGHQPLAFDQWAAFYEYYTVINASWEIECQLTDLTAVMAASVYISPTTSGSILPTSISTVQELGADVVIGNVYSSPHTFKGSLDMGKWFGLTHQELVTDDLKRTSVTLNPADPVYLQLLLNGTSVSSANTIASMRFTFDVIFTVPKIVPPS